MGEKKGVEGDGQPGDDSPPVGTDPGVDPSYVKPKLFRLITDREFGRRLDADGSWMGGNWASVRIAPTPDDDPDYPIYGVYYYQLVNPERDLHVTPRTDISRRILHEDNRHKLLALKANLIEELVL